MLMNTIRTLPAVRFRMRLAWSIALMILMGVVLPREILRWRVAAKDDVSYVFSHWDRETTPVLCLLVLFPLFWIVRGPFLNLSKSTREFWWVRFGADSGPSRASALNAKLQRKIMGWAWLLALVCGWSGWFVAAEVGELPVANNNAGQPVTLRELPPGIHDEYSYRFQAWTILSGRLAFPSSERRPELFNQMHVLNDDGRFASRYLPGTGLWMAPFLAMGNPYLGWWVANGLIAFFIFWAGRELGGNGVGFVAGLLTGVSPGMVDFSQTLLAHHPTLVGLSLFLWQFLRLMRTNSLWSAMLAGAGLAFAMLGRPMTAAAFGLPFGIWLIAWLFKRQKAEVESENENCRIIAFRQRLLTVLMVGWPVLVGVGVIAVYNHATTGSPLVMSYQKYTDIYSPRHVYGFNNVERGEQKLGPKVIDDYDRWAQNLTPTLAFKNGRLRLLESTRWAIGVVPVALGAVFCILLLPDANRGTEPFRIDRRWWLIAASIVSMHVAHLPYWFDGIRHYHYVFETIPLWLLFVGGATTAMWQVSIVTHRRGLRWWWLLLILVSLLPSWIAAEPLWSRSRMTEGIGQAAFARWHYYQYNDWIKENVGDEPALVLVAFPKNTHIEYSTNHPSLTKPVLHGQFSTDRLQELPAIAADFSERNVFVAVVRNNANTQALKELGCQPVSTTRLPATGADVLELWKSPQ